MSPPLKAAVPLEAVAEQAPSAEKLPLKLELRPLGIDLSEFTDYADTYFGRLSHEMKNST